MKTVLQELRSMIEEKMKLYPIQGDAITRRIRGAYVDVMVMVKELLDKEREQIVNTFEKGCKAQKIVCAEHAVMKLHDGHNKMDSATKYHQIGSDNLTVDKDSILNAPDAESPFKTDSNETARGK